MQGLVAQSPWSNEAMLAGVRRRESWRTILLVAVVTYAFVGGSPKNRKAQI